MSYEREMRYCSHSNHSLTHSLTYSPSVLCMYQKVQAMADAVAEERCALFAEMKVLFTKYMHVQLHLCLCILASTCVWRYT